MLEQSARDELVAKLKQKPFLCDAVFLFELREHEPLTGLDSNSTEWLNTLEAELREGLVDLTVSTGNTCFDKMRAGDVVHYYMSVVHGRFLLFLRKRLLAEQADQGTELFNLFEQRQVSLLLNDEIGPPEAWDAAEEGGGETSPHADDEPLLRLGELDDYLECQDLWRDTYGAAAWLAVKSERGVVAHAASEEELHQKLDRMGDIKPPILIVPPEDGRTAHVEHVGQDAGFVGRRQDDEDCRTLRKPGFLRRLLEFGRCARS